MANLFIPSRSRICRFADLLMIFFISVAGLAAALTSLIVQWRGL